MNAVCFSDPIRASSWTSWSAKLPPAIAIRLIRCAITWGAANANCVDLVAREIVLCRLREVIVAPGGVFFHCATFILAVDSAHRRAEDSSIPRTASIRPMERGAQLGQSLVMSGAVRSQWFTRGFQSDLAVPHRPNTTQDTLRDRVLRTDVAAPGIAPSC